MKRKKASNETGCWLLTLIESLDNAICMGDSCGTRHFNSIRETIIASVPNARETDMLTEREGCIQSYRERHVTLPEAPTSPPPEEAVADMIIDLRPGLLIGDGYRLQFCISSCR
ncbi:hypothetical protein PBY51_022936 [Eleginops maclovinus]|uniref:Uncharacterized protein n=1 Tax=Eleginops maclovinus TaxID=56733 RepID=A0AAN7XIU0_ELEMC|nr:hypothetical protein PBY51_022936 [Eleginops maclovinus]